jgi:hypothetical protein
MLFVYLAFEAYLNYLGPRVCPNEWADERTYFGGDGGERYRGTLGKLHRLADEAGVVLEKGRRPYQTVVELDRRRDRLVHGRHEEFDYVVEFKDPKYIPDPEPQIYGLADSASLARAMTDVSAICDELHKRCQELAGEHAISGGAAFVGMIGHHGGSIIEMPE